MPPVEMCSHRVCRQCYCRHVECEPWRCSKALAAWRKFASKHRTMRGGDLVDKEVFMRRACRGVCELSGVQLEEAGDNGFSVGRADRSLGWTAENVVVCTRARNRPGKAPSPVHKFIAELEAQQCPSPLERLIQSRLDEARDRLCEQTAGALDPWVRCGLDCPTPPEVRTDYDDAWLRAHGLL